MECGEGWPETWELSVSEVPRAGPEKGSARSQATPTPVPAPVLPTPDGPSELPSSPALLPLHFLGIDTYCGHVCPPRLWALRVQGSHLFISKRIYLQPQVAIPAHRCTRLPPQRPVRGPPSTALIEPKDDGRKVSCPFNFFPGKASRLQKQHFNLNFDSTFIHRAALSRDFIKGFNRCYKTCHIQKVMEQMHFLCFQNFNSDSENKFTVKMQSNQPRTNKEEGASLQVKGARVTRPHCPRHQGHGHHGNQMMVKAQGVQRTLSGTRAQGGPPVAACPAGPSQTPRLGAGGTVGGAPLCVHRSLGLGQGKQLEF